MNAPATEEGAATWQAATTALRAGVAGAEIDMAAALPLAAALGAPPAVAAPLLRCVAHGLIAAQAKQRETDRG